MLALTTSESWVSSWTTSGPVWRGDRRVGALTFMITTVTVTSDKVEDKRDQPEL